MLETNPIATKVITSGLIAATGDLNCQYIVHMNANQQRVLDGKKETDFSLDPLRTGRFGLLGAFLVAPCIHFWYGALYSKLPGSTLFATLQRTAADQLLFAPVFIVAFVSSLMKLEGKSMKDIKEQVREPSVWLGRKR